MTANDASGNGYNGTWAGTATGTNGYYSPGKVGNWAGAFDGTSTYIDSVGLRLNSLNSLSISAWINPSTVSGTQQIFIENSPLMFSLSGNKLRAGVYNGTSWSPVSGAVSLSANQWIFVTAIYNGQNISVYENGVFDASVSQTGSTPASNPCSEIGRLYTTGCETGVSGYFNGLDRKSVV